MPVKSLKMEGYSLKQLGTARGSLVAKALLAALALTLPLFLINNNYALYVLCFIMMYSIAISGLDILFGYSGQISMGQVAYFAIGAYGSTLMNNYLGIPVLLTMLIASVAAAAIGALIAFPASKLKFHFLSLATIAFAEVVYQIIIHSPGNITNNLNGIFAKQINLFGLILDNNFKLYYFALFCLAIFLVAKHLLIRSRVGRAFMAIRDNTHAADGMGINVRKYKVSAFATSSFYTAFAGAFYAHLVGYISPDTFVLKQSLTFLTMMIFGGTGSIFGPVIGAASIQLINELLRKALQYQLLIYGILVVVVILLLPGGIYNAGLQLFRKLTARFRKEKG